MSVRRFHSKKKQLILNSVQVTRLLNTINFSKISLKREFKSSSFIDNLENMVGELKKNKIPRMNIFSLIPLLENSRRESHLIFVIF